MAQKSILAMVRGGRKVPSGDRRHQKSGVCASLPAAAYAALEEAATAQVVAKGLTGQFKEVVNVGGTDVIVKQGSADLRFRSAAFQL
jgi:hypothetical protein